LVEPLPEKKGLTGQDKITTQEMSRAQSHGAALFGVTSFEATGSGMGEYMKNLKEKIWLAWFPYLAFHYPQDTRGADAVVSITLDAQGKVKILRLIENEGSPVFATYCLEAIQRAGTFGPLPEEILILTGKDEFEIKFGFHYR
jgi:outer membrane biosynthesis protein TonB